MILVLVLSAVTYTLTKELENPRFYISDKLFCNAYHMISYANKNQAIKRVVNFLKTLLSVRSARGHQNYSTEGWPFSKVRFVHQLYNAEYTIGQRFPKWVPRNPRL